MPTVSLFAIYARNDGSSGVEFYQIFLFFCNIIIVTLCVRHVV